MSRTLVMLLGLSSAGLAMAAGPTTPEALIDGYRAQAASENSAYTPSAEAGAAFYGQAFTHSEAMPSCSSCHTADPKGAGRHAVTGKAIDPLSPLANPKRFTDPAKVEKWFGRNCREVVGRACTAAEKADFISYLTKG